MHLNQLNMALTMSAAELNDRSADLTRYRNGLESMRQDFNARIHEQVVALDRQIATIDFMAKKLSEIADPNFELPEITRAQAESERPPAHPLQNGGEPVEA